jgi:CubicO group peptidase (beta-lactamase class C family)
MSVFIHIYSRQNIESRLEQGSSFAVFYRGQLVVDLWGGYADFGALKYRKHDSMSMVYSATKAATAICMAMLVDR